MLPSQGFIQPVLLMSIFELGLSFQNADGGLDVF